MVIESQESNWARDSWNSWQGSKDGADWSNWASHEWWADSSWGYWYNRHHADATNLQPSSEPIEPHTPQQQIRRSSSVQSIASVNGAPTPLPADVAAQLRRLTTVDQLHQAISMLSPSPTTATTPHSATDTPPSTPTVHTASPAEAAPAAASQSEAATGAGNTEATTPQTAAEAAAQGELRKKKAHARYMRYFRSIRSIGPSLKHITRAHVQCVQRNSGQCSIALLMVALFRLDFTL